MLGEQVLYPVRFFVDTTLKRLIHTIRIVIAAQSKFFRWDIGIDVKIFGSIKSFTSFISSNSTCAC